MGEQHIGHLCNKCGVILTKETVRNYTAHECPACYSKRKNAEGRKNKKALEPKKAAMKKFLDVAGKDRTQDATRSTHVAQVTEGVIQVFGGAEAFCKYFHEVAQEAREKGQFHVVARLVMGVMSMVKESTKYDDMYAADKMVNEQDMDRAIRGAIQEMVTPEMLYAMAESAGLRIYIEGHEPDGDDDDVGTGFEEHAA